jgi:hypothetical protein
MACGLISCWLSNFVINKDYLVNQNRQTPHLSFIIVCQRVEDANGKLNFYGVADIVTVHSSVKDMPAAPVKLFVAVAIFSQDKSQSYPSKLTMQLPNGNEIGLAAFVFGDDAGKYVGREIMPFEFEFEQSGLHWLNIYIDGQLRGQAPLWVRYEREFVH